MMRLIPFNCIICIVLCSCVIPDSNHVEPEYHLLTDKSVDHNGSLHLPSISFHVREVSIPPYLDDHRIVRRQSGTSINYLENHRWGEPISEGISRVVGLNLSTLLGSLAYSSYPSRSRLGSLYEVEISIIRFEKTEDSYVNISAVIEIFHHNNLQVQFKINEQIPASGKKSSIEIFEMSEGLSVVSSKIAKSIHQLPLSQCLQAEVEDFEVNEMPLDKLLTLLNLELGIDASKYSKRMEIIRLSSDFDSNNVPLISLKVVDKSLFEIIKLVNQKSSTVLKFSSSGIVFHEIP